MRKQNGFTLLEILVTMLIITFALLGLAGIIASGLKNNQSSYSRSQASWLANDIIDRMRANRATAEGVGLPYNVEFGFSAPGTPDVPGEDLTAWHDALVAILPAGTGRVNIDAGTRKVIIVVRWDDSRGSRGDTLQEFKVETRL